MTATMGALAPSHDVLTQMGAMMGVGGTIGAIISSRIAVSDGWWSAFRVSEHVSHTSYKQPLEPVSHGVLIRSV